MANPPPPTLHPVILVLCHYDERGQGIPYRERDCVHCFQSVERYTAWIKLRSLAGHFYAYPLRGLSPQLAHLKLFKKNGIAGVVYDPGEPGAEAVPIDDLAAAIEAALAREGPKPNSHDPRLRPDRP